MGFDNECILNIQSLAGEYFCPVCRLLVYPHEALQSQCTHLYCKPCLTYVASTTRACPYDGYLVTEADSKPLLESNKVLSDTIGKIAVHCLYYRSGCTWQGTLSDCTSHCLSCAFGNSPVVCNRCGIQIVHRQVQEHAQSCPGVQSQAQQTENIQNAAGTATATSADQSQAHTQNSAVVATSGQQSEQANSITQAQVPPNPVQSSDQWYQQQQQQQYQQYYAQYSGYDAYQQHYLQYYPYQQQAVQQYQQQPVQVHPAPSVLPGQVPPQVCMQPQTQFQQQPQPQIQSQPQMQAQLQQQPQPQAQTPLQSLPTQSVQAPLGTQYQNQSVNPQQQPPPSVQPQPQPPSHGQSISQTQPYHHGHTQPQPNLVQPQMQSHHQTPQYQQPHLMIQQPQTPAGLAQPLPTQSLQQPHTQPRPQSQYQAHLQPHPQPHPPFQHHSLSQGPHAQPSQPSQPYTQHSSVHAVTGHNSYLLPQAQQQMAVPQHPMQVHPQTVPTQTHQPQHAFPVQSQPVQQPGQVHPLNSNAPAQPQPPLLPSPGRVPSLPPPPHLVNPLSQQPNHLVNQRPVMQPNQQPSQLHGQKQVLYAGQSQGSLQNQSHQISPLVPQNFSAQSQLRPQGPLPIPSQSHILQHPHAHPPSQNLPSSQSYVGRPLIPGGSQSQSFLQTPGAHAGTSQARPMPLSVNLESTNQNSRRTTNQVVPPSDYGHMQQSAQWVTGTTSKVTTLEKQDNHFSNKGPVEHIVSSSSHKIENLDNNSVTSSSLGANSVEVGVLKSETDKRMDDEHKPHQDGTSDVEILGSSKALYTDSKSQEIEHAEPVIKQKVKEEAAANVDQKDDNKAGHAENSSVDNKGCQRQAEFNEHRNGKLESDAVDADAVVKIGIDDVDNAGHDFTAAPTSVSNSSAQIVVGQGQLPDREKIKIDRALPHGEAIPQGPAFDEHKSLPALAQVPAQGHVLSSQQRPSAPHGPPLVPRRPSAPLMLPSVPSAAVPHYGRGLGLPPAQLRPQGTGHFSQPGQLENFQRFGGVPGSYGVSFGSGPVSFGPSPRSFESQPSFHGPNNILQDEAFRGMPPAELPPGSFDRLGGMLGGPMLGKGLQYAPEGPMGLQRFNPMDVEPFPNKRHCYTDDRQSDLQKMGPVVGGPFGHLSGHQSKVERLDGTQGLSNKKFSFGEEHLNVEHNQHVIGRGVYADDLKHHSKPPHLDADSVPKFGNQLTFSRASDMGPHSLGFDAIPHSFDKAPYNSRPGLNLDSGSCGVTPGFMPSYQSGFQERRGRLASYEENVNKPDLTHTSAEFLGSGAGYGQRHIDVLNSRNPVGEFHPPGYGSSGPGSQTILDDVDGRESHQFEESSRPYNAPFGSFRESRFPDFSSRFGRSDFDGSANLRAGELISGRDFPSSQFLHNERIGPRELSSHLPQGEPGGFGSYPRGPAHLGELAAPKNFPRHFFAGEPFGTDSKLRPQLGEPGFRSSYSLHGHHNDRGFFLGNMESIDILRKRKPGSMGWCRICEVDSETLEGLDLHSQTREHQKKAMDMVTNIKKKNPKKQKISLGAHSHASVEDTNKSQNVTFDGREN